MDWSIDGQTPEFLAATRLISLADPIVRTILADVPLEPGMTIAPVFTAVTPDGAEREYQGPAVTVPAEGLALTWDRVPAGSYLYCFGLTDLSGTVHYTDTAAISF